MRAAAHIKGLETTASDWEKSELVFITHDVNSDADLPELNRLIEGVMAAIDPDAVLVLTSQVPIGFSNDLVKRHAAFYYQVDTLIMDRALERATNPEQFIVGSEDVEALRPSYQSYIDAFEHVPVVRMTLAAAELTKHAINYYLAAQLAATNVLSKLSEGPSSWERISMALRNDKRIGQYAYLKPGIIGGHLPRDVMRIKTASYDSLTNAIAEQCRK